MLKKINWKLLFKGFAWIVCLSGVVVLMSFVSIKKQTVSCTNIKILIPGADNFIEREEIDAILKQSQGILIGKKLQEINLENIEKSIKSNPYIAQAKVFADMDGVIHIEISQRQPILRVINSSDQDYYIDRDGLKMPVSPNFTANVLVANGKILEYFSGKVDTLITKMAVDLYKTALFIKRDSLWDAQIEQLFVNDKNDIELVPRVGNQHIILGSADSLEVKMRNLLAFYKQAMPKVGWDTYRTINIKYTNQIVCEKIDSLAVRQEKITTPPDTMGNGAGQPDLVQQQIVQEIKKDINQNTGEKVAEKKEIVKKEKVAEKKDKVAEKKPEKPAQPAQLAKVSVNETKKVKEKSKTDTKKNK
ncbi:cell division protein FtsQ/DivIB [Pedobacter metabolipauper]|uniref:Cell division protein FtsQ n=1 Tax=Pedobacter metabolipauper TaxID=425513 RepID=A0A4V3D121_9SPHI|nr:cell division protein FtsQ [Pedobacter metabolipauper]TDQ08614.1 cell division protein FtsQ [Pedobacter metabolipauper]